MVHCHFSAIGGLPAYRRHDDLSRTIGELARFATSSIQLFPSGEERYSGRCPVSVVFADQEDFRSEESLFRAPQVK
jgi:hypothetical protein